MDPLDHLGRQDGGQLVGHPAGKLAPRVRVGHVAQGAGGPAEGRHQEPCHDYDGQCQRVLGGQTWSPVRWDTPLINPFWFG